MLQRLLLRICRLAGTVLKVADVTGINIESIVVSVIGAVIVVAAYRLLMGRRSVA